MPARALQLDVRCETKTKDNVFVQVRIGQQDGPLR